MSYRKEMRLPGWYHVDHMKTQTGNRLGFWYALLAIVVPQPG